jgi:ring-1,2-phenylacetyl-CoA epoxidase subunit PaaC
MTQAIENYAVRLADDALIHGQRLAEWCSHGPTLEEDLALANVALDYIGRARMYYDYAGASSGTSEDEYAFGRDTRQFTNLLIYELPNGDFAHTLVRQYLLDEFEALFLRGLAEVSDSNLAVIAQKSLKETTYHLRRSRQWMQRFGLGTDESHARATRALEELWGYTPELFSMDDVEAGLLTDGQAVDRGLLADPWREQVTATLVQAGLTIPDASWQVVGGRQGVHTEHMGHLLAEMQVMQRSYPGLNW